MKTTILQRCSVTFYIVVHLGLTSAQQTNSNRVGVYARPIVPDFQVNENVGHGTFQNDPVVAADATGGFVIVWEDGRNGVSDIYAQRYQSDGTPSRSNFKINDDDEGWHHYNPAISMDHEGNFIVAWQGQHNGDDDIYWQRYSRNGDAIGTNLRVNDDEGTAVQRNPSIDTDGLGNFVVVWDDNRLAPESFPIERDIFCQRFGQDGSPLGANFKVDNELGVSEQEEPSVAADASGNFAIVWADDRHASTGFDIYCQRYANDGSAISTNFMVNDEAERQQTLPALAMNSEGQFVVVWRDNRDGPREVFCQRYDADATPLGANFRVNEEGGSSSFVNPAVAIDNSGGVVVTWEDRRNVMPADSEIDIFFQRYSSDGSPIGSNAMINEETQSTKSEPAVAIDGTGNFVVAWQDIKMRLPDAFFRRFGGDGLPVESSRKANDDELSSYQSQPSVATDATGGFAVAWRDYRDRQSRDSDIYIQWYDQLGAPQGVNVRVNDDQNPFEQSVPDLTMNEQGNSVIVWTEVRNGIPDLFFQRFDGDRTAVGSNIRVVDPAEFSQREPRVAMDQFGNFAIVWTDIRGVVAEPNDRGDIYCQRYDAEGVAVSELFLVSEEQEGIDEQDHPSISMNGQGDFVIAWHQYGFVNPLERHDIYCQRYDVDGSPIGANFKVNDDDGTRRKISTAVAMNDDGSFVVVWWEDYRLYGQRYASDATRLGDNFAVLDGENISDLPIAVSLDQSGEFLVIWESVPSVGRPDIYCQRFANDGTKIGQNLRVNQQDKKSQTSPDVELRDGRIYSAWVTNHVGETAFDIWANVLDFNNPVSVENHADVPALYTLRQNYPNPFNPATTIRYSLPSAASVTLEIINALGQEVKILAAGFQTAGRHEVRFDASGLASGIYFYRLRVGDFVAVRKMLLLQ